MLEWFAQQNKSTATTTGVLFVCVAAVKFCLTKAKKSNNSKKASCEKLEQCKKSAGNATKILQKTTANSVK